MAMHGEDWGREEVEALVADYLSMLAFELRHESVNKAEHNRRLQTLIGRSHGSIERKHQNVSAVLRDLGFPWVDGYKPLGHRQLLLEEVLLAQLEIDRFGIQTLATTIATAPATTTPVPPTTEGIEVAPPEREQPSGYADEDPPRNRPPRLIDYVGVDARNRSLGRAGEEFVVEYESRRLFDAGRPDLAKRIEHVAATQGDGLGYDIGSFELGGRPRLIEVKTTSFGKRTPFFVSRNEVHTSDAQATVYRLYRVFNFRTRPQFFGLAGSLRTTCSLIPEQYMARAT